MNLLAYLIWASIAAVSYGCSFLYCRPVSASFLTPNPLFFAKGPASISYWHTRYFILIAENKSWCRTPQIKGAAAKAVTSRIRVYQEERPKTTKISQEAAVSNSWIWTYAATLGSWFLLPVAAPLLAIPGRGTTAVGSIFYHPSWRMSSSSSPRHHIDGAHRTTFVLLISYQRYVRKYNSKQ